MKDHPTTGDIIECFLGELSPERSDEIEAHVLDCDDCQRNAMAIYVSLAVGLPREIPLAP